MPLLVIKEDLDQLPDDQLITIEEFCNFLSISRTSHWRHVKNGRLPTPIRIGQNSMRHRLGDARAISRGKYTSRVKV